MPDYHIPHARRIGDMTTGREGSYTGPTRHCERCGARLRHRNHTTTCAPCQAATPMPNDTATNSPKNLCAWCERPYTPWNRTQKYCSMNCSERARQTRHKIRRVSAP